MAVFPLSDSAQLPRRHHDLRAPRCVCIHNVFEGILAQDALTILARDYNNHGLLSDIIAAYTLPPIPYGKPALEARIILIGITDHKWLCLGPLDQHLAACMLNLRTSCKSAIVGGYYRTEQLGDLYDRKFRKGDKFLNAPIAAWTTPAQSTRVDVQFPPLPVKGRTSRKVSFNMPSTLNLTTANSQAQDTQPITTMVTTSAGKLIDLTTLIGDLVDDKMAARDATVQEMSDKINSLQTQIEVENTRAAIRAFRDKEARLAETMMQHDGMVITNTRRTRELDATADNLVQERNHLKAIIDDNSDKMASLRPYIKKVHNSLTQEAILLGIKLIDISDTLDF